jgi:hypothetical protein
VSPNQGKYKRLKKITILYRLIWVMDSSLLAVVDLAGFFVRSRKSTSPLVK